MTTNLDHKSTISLWAIFAALPVLVSAVIWFATLGFKDAALADNLKKVEDKQKNIEDVIYDMHDRIVRIEEKLNHMTHGKGK